MNPNHGREEEIFDAALEMASPEEEQDKTLRRYLKPDLVIIDDMGLKALPKHSGEYLLEVGVPGFEVPAIGRFSTAR